MKLFAAFAAALMLAGSAAAMDAPKVYEPMQPFAPLAGKTLRGEWQDADGKTTVDFAKWEWILGGRALQTTHRIEGADYGGTTVIFYDEAAKSYVFHYFTTGGFHTTGTGTFADGFFSTTEKVNGHPQVAEVVARSTLGPEEMRVVVNYVDKSGVRSSDIVRVYKPTTITPRLF